MMYWALWVGIAAADGPAMSLDIDPLTPGASVDIGVYQAAPGARVLLVRSDGGEGRGHAIVGGPRMGIRPGSGYEILLEKRANAHGFAEWHVPVFPDVAEGDWWFQAIVIAGDDSQTSHVLHRPVFVDERLLDDAAEPDDDDASATRVTDNGVYERRSCDSPDRFVTDLAPGEAITVDFARRYGRPDLTLRAGEDVVTVAVDPQNRWILDSHLSWLNEGSDVASVSIEVGPSDACTPYTLHTRMGPVEDCVPPIEGSSPEEAIELQPDVPYPTTMCPGTEAYFNLIDLPPHSHPVTLVEGLGPFEYQNPVRLAPDALGRARPLSVWMSNPDYSGRTTTLLQEGLQTLDVHLGGALHYVDIPTREERWTWVTVWGSQALRVDANSAFTSDVTSGQRAWGRSYEYAESWLELAEYFDGVVTPATVLVEFSEPIDCTQAPAAEPIILGHAGETWTRQVNCGQPQTFRIEVPAGMRLNLEPDYSARVSPSRRSFTPDDNGIVELTVVAKSFPYIYALKTYTTPMAPAAPPPSPNTNVYPFTAIPVDVGEVVETGVFENEYWYVLDVDAPGTFELVTTRGRDIELFDVSGMSPSSESGSWRDIYQLNTDTFIRTRENSTFQVIRLSGCPGVDRDEPIAPTLAGELCPGQTHRLSFDAQAGETWRYSLDGLGLVDILVEMPDGTVSPAGTHEGWFEVRAGMWQASQTGPHRLLLVSGRLPTVVTSRTAFTLQWEQAPSTPCTVDAQEPNDQREDASAMVSTDAVVCVLDDDWYTIDVSEGDLFDIAVSGDVRTTIEGPFPPPHRRPFLMEEDSTMVLRVEHSGSAQDGTMHPEPYTIELTHDSCTGQDPEADTADDASVLVVGDTYSGTLCPADVDVFMIALPDDWEPGRPGLGFEIDLAVTAQGATAAPYLLTPTDGGYLLTLNRRPVVGATFSYTLTLIDTRVSCIADIYEPNDTPETAAVVGPGQHELTACADNDYFTVSVPAHHGLQVRGANYGSGYLPDSRSGYGDKVFVDTDTDILLQSRQELLDVDIVPPCSQDGFEPNGLHYLAASIPNGHHIAQLCLHRWDEDDWYRIDLLRGEHLALHLEFDNSETDLSLELYDDRRRLLAVSDWNFQSFDSTSWVAASDQSVYVRIRQAIDHTWFVRPGDNYDLTYDLFVDTVP